MSSSRCRRCGCEPFIILDRVHVECKDCFVESSMRKFRQTIGKSKLVQNNDPLLVAHSGGQSSTALLHMLKTWSDSCFASEPRFRPQILHIDMQSINCDLNLSQIQEDRLKNLDEFLKGLKQKCTNWPVHWTTIESCMVESDSCDSYCTYDAGDDLRTKGYHLLTNEDSHRAFKEAIRQSGDLTDRQKFVSDKCSELINRIARKINSDIEVVDDKLKFVLVGSSATQLANNLLVDVILGQGSTIRSTVCVVDDRPSVPLLRPLRDFSKKEIAFYLRARNLEALVQPSLITKVDRKACIQTTTEAFLSKLYVDYPATYNTLLRTGGKLA
jgi:cytoplasmic tRNA 2-thiolation protein 2